MASLECYSCVNFRAGNKIDYVFFSVSMVDNIWEKDRLSEMII